MGTDFFDGDDCVFGITKFSDLFEDEFAKTKLGYKAHEEDFNATVLSFQDIVVAPTTVDWRPKGAVSAVKDQGDCGSCWAFSATEEIESQIFMSTGKLPKLSTQQIISCDKTDDGCDGGNTETAYKYVTKAGGIDTAAELQEGYLHQKVQWCFRRSRPLCAARRLRQVWSNTVLDRQE